MSPQLGVFKEKQGTFKEKLGGSALTLILHAWESLHDLGYLAI